MNTKLFLLIGTSLSFIPTLTYAQCVATQDCETLGYTETSCNGGKGVKCPFGNKWACIMSCENYGFIYTCKDTGDAKAVGNPCNNKYQKCICKTNYVWNENKGCICDASFAYSCNRSNEAGGVGTACDGKYKSCKCKNDGEIWQGSSCGKRQYTEECSDSCPDYLFKSCSRIDKNKCYFKISYSYRDNRLESPTYGQYLCSYNVYTCHD